MSANHHAESCYVSQFSHLSLTANGVDDQVRLITTPHGDFIVAAIGNRNNPVLVTVHDLGLNHQSNFESFFNIPEVRALSESFYVLHIDIPGQASEAEQITGIAASNPCMTQILSGLEIVLREFNIKCFVGFGYGAGAYLLSLLALQRPDSVSALALINACADSASWTDYGYGRVYSIALKTGGFSRGVLDYLRWYHCGRADEFSFPDLVRSFDDRILRQNPFNLAQWIEAYMKRPSLGLQRPVSGLERSKCNFRCPVLLIVGRESPHLEPTRRMFALCDPQLVTILELANCRAPLDESPAKVVEAMALLLQGAGYPLTKLRKISMATSDHAECGKPLLRQTHFGPQSCE